MNERHIASFFVIAPLFGEAENSNWVREPKLERRPQKLGLLNFRLLKWWRGKILVPRTQLIQLSFWALTNETFAQFWVQTEYYVFFFFLLLDVLFWSFWYIYFHLLFFFIFFRFLGLKIQFMYLYTLAIDSVIMDKLKKTIEVD